jgi:hypothetical protein
MMYSPQHDPLCGHGPTLVKAACPLALESASFNKGMEFLFWLQKYTFIDVAHGACALRN